MGNFIFKRGKPYCPHCDWPLKAANGEWLCGICASSFVSSETHLANAKQVLDLEDKKLGKVALVKIYDGRLPFWKVALSFFGFPVEEESYDTDLFPYLSFLFVLTCALIAGLGLDVMPYSLDPTQLSRKGGLNFLSYSLVHADLWHLVGNLFFVWPFLNNVEENLGHGKFLMLLLTSSVGSGLLHIAFDSTGLPLVGSSGVCFAVMVYYCLIHPNNRFLISLPLVGILMHAHRLRVRAWVLALAFVGLEAFQVLGPGAGFTDVSHWGHLGGALTGVGVYFFFRRSGGEAA